MVRVRRLMVYVGLCGAVCIAHGVTSQVYFRVCRSDIVRALVMGPSPMCRSLASSLDILESAPFVLATLSGLGEMLQELSDLVKTWLL
jgi:hypothetical protein